MPIDPALQNVPTDPNDPFNQVPTDQVDPFGQVPPTPATPPVTPSATPRQGAVLAMAQVDSSADFNTIVQQYTQLNEGYQQTIRDGQEAILRQQIAADQQRREIEGLQALQYRANPEDQITNEAVAAASIQAAQNSIQRRAEAAVEQQTVQNIQDAAARGDIGQARLLFHNFRDGDASQVIHDINVRHLILQREIENAQIAEQHMPWFSHVANFILTMVPFRNTWARNGAMDVEQGMKHWYDFLMGGERINAERSNLWRLPPEQFAQYVREQLIPNIRRRATILGYENQSQTLNILSQFNQSVPAWQTNAMDLFDNLGLLPWGRVTRIATIPATLARLGARREQTALIAAAAKAVAEGGGANAERILGVTAADLETNMLPNAVNAGGSETAISIAGDVNANLARVRAMLTEKLGDLFTGRFTSDAERQAAIEAATKEVTERIGRDVKDVISVTPGETRVLGSSPVHYVDVVVGKKSGGLYSSERAARRAAADMSYPLADILPIDPEAGAAGGTTRVYHGGRVGDTFEPGSGNRWVSTSRKYAQQYADQAPAGEGQLYHMDLPNDHPFIQSHIEDLQQGVSASGALEHGDFQHLRPVERGPLSAARTTSTRTRQIINPDGSTSEISITDQIPSHIEEGVPVAEIIPDHSGGYGIRIRTNVPETAFYTNPIVNRTTNIASRMLLNASHTGDAVMDAMRQAGGNRRSVIIREIAKEAERNLRGLPEESRRLIEQISLAGNNADKWSTEDEIHIVAQKIFGRNATSAELTAYHTIHEVSDAIHQIRNDTMWTNKVIRGLETVSFDAGIGTIERENAVLDRAMAHAPGEPAYDLTNGRHWLRGELSAERLEELRKTGHYIVRTERPIDLSDGTRRRVFIVRNKELSIEPLRQDQLAYRPGSSRIYNHRRYFVKQAVFTTARETGERILENPMVHITGTRAEVTAWARVMEEARLAYLARKDIAEVAEILGERPGFPTPEQFVDHMENPTIHGFQADQPFEILFDREMPRAYSEARSSPYEFVDRDEPAVDGFLRSQGQMYYSRRGEALRDWMGNRAPTLDAFQTINESLMNIASLSSFNDYKNSLVERWVRTYGHLLDKGTEGQSSWYRFTHGVISPSMGREAERQAALNEREIAQRTLGWKTEADFQFQYHQQRLEDWIMGNNPESIRHEIGRQFGDWWNTNNPIQAMRGFAMDMKLGLLNPAQLLLQASTMVAAFSIEPREGLRAFAVAPFMRMFLRKGATEADLDLMIQRGVHTAAGFEDAKEFREFMNIGRASGFFDFANNHIMVDQYGPNAAMGGFQNNVQRALHAGRLFWNEGETWNRAVAWRMAWAEARKTSPRLAIRSEEFLRTVQGLANKYSFSMSEQSAAAWQRGILSVPTQFWSYNMNMLQMMFGSQLTRQQRARLIIGQFLLAGSAGVPFLSALDRFYEQQTGHPVGSSATNPDQMNNIVGALDRGLFTDFFIHALTGADIQVGSRIGTGDFLPGLIQDIFGFSQYGTKSTADMFGGAGGSTGIAFVTGLIDVARYATAESGGQMNNALSRQAVLNLASNISTLSNISKAVLIYRYGEYISNRGNVLMNDVPQSAAFAQALGFTPGEYGAFQASMLNSSHRNQVLQDAVNTIRQYRTRMVNEPDNREQIQEEINLYVRLLPDSIRQDALRRSHASTDPSLYAHVAQQIRQREAQEELQRQIEAAQQGTQ